MLSSDEIRWLKRVRSGRELRFVNGVILLLLAALQFLRAYEGGITYQMPDGTRVLTQGFLHLLLAISSLILSLRLFVTPAHDRLLVSLAEKMGQEDDKEG